MPPAKKAQETSLQAGTNGRSRPGDATLPPMSRAHVRIEFPSAGATYSRPEYGVYRYDEFPRGSVLAGQERRTFLRSFKTLAEARAAYPDAIDAGCGYREPYLNHLPDDDGEAELAAQDGRRDAEATL